MLARLSAFVIWALVAATAVFWGLRLFVRAPSAPGYTVAVGESTAVHGDLSRVLGATPANAPLLATAPAASSRFKLLGIVAPRYASSDDERAPRGVALIAVDGKMPKAFAVGARVDGDLVLQAVSLRTVSIGGGQGAAPITLELPPPANAATGTLPAGMVGGPAGAPVPGAAPAFVPVPPYQPVGAYPGLPQQLPQGFPAPMPSPPMGPRGEGVTPQ